MQLQLQTHLKEANENENEHEKVKEYRKHDSRTVEQVTLIKATCLN